MAKKLFHLLVVLAIALVVPIQGIAAVSAGICMGLGHGGAHSHDSGAADHHHGADPHDEGAAGGTSGGAHCPPCASCCAVTAIASFPLVFIPESPAAALIAALLPGSSGVVPEKLDRPPLAL